MTTVHAHDVHWLTEKCKKSQTLWLLFMHSAWTIATSLTNAWKKKKQKNANTNANVVPKRSPILFYSALLFSLLLNSNRSSWFPNLYESMHFNPWCYPDVFISKSCLCMSFRSSNMYGLLLSTTFFVIFTYLLHSLK